MNGKYTIELCRPGGEDTGIERVFERQDDLAIARKLYQTIATEYPLALSCYVIARVCWHAATGSTQRRIDAGQAAPHEARRIAVNIARPITHPARDDDVLPAFRRR
jgi:hypothetical protein